MAILTGSCLTDCIGLATALIVVAYAYFKWQYQYWKRRNVPCIEPTIPFGNFENPLRRTGPQANTVLEAYKYARSKGWRHCGLYMLTQPMYLVVDLDLVKHVLTKDFQYFVDRGTYTNEKVDPIGCHLFSLNGERWRKLRAKLTPTFTTGKLKAMFHTLTDCGVLLEKYIEKNIDSKTAVNIKQVLGCFTTDVIGSCAFGLECNSFKEPESPFRKFGGKVFTISKLDSMRVIFCMNFPTLAKVLGMRQVSKDVSDFYTKIVTDMVAYREKNNYTRKDFLQLLIDMKNKRDGHDNGNNGGDTLTMDEIVAQSFIFFLAGFETSSTTMTFALFELATHPEIQDKVRKEINTVLEKHDNQITYDSLSEMKYLKQVIDETLRLRSPARILRRECVMDYKVPGEDVVIEKGTKVSISITGIHEDEEYYKNPKVFDPEQFNEENKKTRHPYAYLPFGEGPRVCIGERFGIMQTTVGLTSILRKFKVTLNEKTKVPLTMSASSGISDAKGGIWLNIEKI